MIMIPTRPHSLEMLQEGNREAQGHTLMKANGSDPWNE